MGAVKGSDKIRKLPHKFVASKVDGELILIHGDSGEFFALTDIGLEIWRLLDEEHDVVAIADRLVSLYDVPQAECERDVRKFANQIVEVGFAEAA